MGIAKSAGHTMTFKTIKDDTQKIVCQSNVRPNNDPLTRNLRIDPTIAPVIIKSRQETFTDDDTISTDPSTIPEDSNYQARIPVHVIETSNLLGDLSS